LQYLHVGIGFPGIRSYNIIVCNTFTSSCAKKHHIHGLNATASVVDKVFRRLFALIPELQEPFHVYKHSHREYRVYRYSEDLARLINMAIAFAYALHRYCKYDRRCYSRVMQSAFNACSSVGLCLQGVNLWMQYMNRVLEGRRKAGKKALLTRLERSTWECLHIIKKYFSDVESAPTFKVSEIGFSECFEDAIKILRKLFPEDVARRYANRICAGGNSIYLFARGAIIAIDARYAPTNVKIFYESCTDTPGYAMVKLVGASLVDGYINRIDWVALLGYDKQTNQVFLHYIPPTLIFKDIERARLWLLGLVDRWGNMLANFELIEA
jgi:hypothetical protein